MEITFNNNHYNLVQRKAKKGELVQSQVYISSNYPTGTVMKVLKESMMPDEVIVCPTWYEDGMECFGIKAYLEANDYLVLVET